MPYKASLSDPETFRKLRCTNVALCRAKRSLASQIKDRERWEHELSFCTETLAFALDPARYETLQEYIALIEAVLVAFDNQLRAERNVIASLERVRQVIHRALEAYIACFLAFRSLPGYSSTIFPSSAIAPLDPASERLLRAIARNQR
jgi:hypothetical protein